MMETLSMVMDALKRALLKLDITVLEELKIPQIYVLKYVEMDLTGRDMNVMTLIPMMEMDALLNVKSK